MTTAGAECLGGGDEHELTLCRWVHRSTRSGSHRAECFKRVDGTVCGLYPNKAVKEKRTRRTCLEYFKDCFKVRRAPRFPLGKPWFKSWFLHSLDVGVGSIGK